jgi:tetratricopeptide (TPR) repeat protein
MKNWITILLLCIGSFAFSQQNDHYEELFQEANNIYASENYDSAKYAYEAIIATGAISTELYYNTANCYYKLKTYPSAVLYYEKALKLNPTDEDIKFNLDVANQHITDKIEALPTIFYVSWWNNIVNILNLSMWTKMSIYTAIIICISLALFFIIQSEQLKKLSFYSTLFFAFNFIISYSAANTAKNRIEIANTAIVFAPSLNVKSAPSSNGTKLFVIHEGTKVNIIQVNNNWVEISLADGNIGWVEKMTIINI